MPGLSESNKAVIVRLYEEALNQARFDVADELVAPDAVLRNVPYGAGTGPELLKSVWRSLHEAFSDLRFELEHIMAEGDQVAVRGSTTGVHIGPFAGHEPTGRRVSERAHVFYRLRDNMIQEVWPMVDRPGLISQLAGPPRYSPVCPGTSG